VLATASITVPAGGAWTQLPYSLTPSGSTACVGIDSDPEISCSNPFPDYICIKCAGELSFAISSPGAFWVGYARLEPGPAVVARRSLASNVSVERERQTSMSVLTLVTQC
jgi:hypothetical protein